MAYKLKTEDYITIIGLVISLIILVLVIILYVKTTKHKETQDDHSGQLEGIKTQLDFMDKNTDKLQTENQNKINKHGLPKLLNKEILNSDISEESIDRFSAFIQMLNNNDSQLSKVLNAMYCKENPRTKWCKDIICGLEDFRSNDECAADSGVKMICEMNNCIDPSKQKCSKHSDCIRNSNGDAAYCDSEEGVCKTSNE